MVRVLRNRSWSLSIAAFRERVFRAASNGTGIQNGAPGRAFEAAFHSGTLRGDGGFALRCGSVTAWCIAGAAAGGSVCTDRNGKEGDILMSDTKQRGVVHIVEDTKAFGQNGFRKRVVVLEQENGRFTNYIPFEFTQDRCELANDLQVGEEIEITYRLNGRKWQKDPASEVKFFLSAEATGFRRTAEGNGDGDRVKSANAAFAEAGDFDDDDVPF